MQRQNTFYLGMYLFKGSLSPKKWIKKCMLSLSGPKPNVKTTRPIMITFSQNLYFKARIDLFVGYKK